MTSEQRFIKALKHSGIRVNSIDYILLEDGNALFGDPQTQQLYIMFLWGQHYASK